MVKRKKPPHPKEKKEKKENLLMNFLKGVAISMQSCLLLTSAQPVRALNPPKGPNNLLTACSRISAALHNLDRIIFLTH